MKVRVKFAKEGAMKFIGHLDTMRYFQKAIRRAGLPIAYSEGFSPHMILSFAAPLGVGIESRGEYFDMELTETLPTREIAGRLDAAMAEGFRVLSAKKVEEGKAGKAMSLVAAADYFVTFREGKAFAPGWQKRLAAFFEQTEIPVWKKTKRSEKEADIRPYIYELQTEGDGIFMKLASASDNYTKPEQVLNAFARFLGEEPAPFAYQLCRLEVYGANKEAGGPPFLTLEELGEDVE